MLNERPDRGRRRSKSHRGQPAPAAEPAYDPALFLPPLKPNRKLLIAVAVVLGVWAAVLVTMYVTTVPSRGQAAGDVRK